MIGHDTTLRRMREAIDRHDLLTHPFYRAWSAGTLPLSALVTYASEYGAFVRLLDRGWNTLGEPEAATVERHHARLWQEFAHALGAEVAARPAVASVQALVDEAAQSFVDPAAAAGALYAFERQQPATARSKLDGLDAHYSRVPDSARHYFRAHALETGEDVVLEGKVAAMDDAGRLRAAGACERMSRALWDALTGIQRESA